MLAALAAAGCLAPAGAQVFDFKGVAVPQARSLSTHYMFYVYTEKDAPQQGEATVHFSGLGSAHMGGGAAPEGLKDYQGLQVSILPYKDFWKLINPNKFCASGEDVQEMKATSEGQLMLLPQAKDSGASAVVMHTVRAAGEQQPAEEEALRQPLKTGVYVLTLSNCGDLNNLSVQGTVVVKSSWGFLPAIEYYKKPLYGCLAVFYVCATLGWLVLALRWWKQLFYIQKGITAVCLMATLETVSWWIFYANWNGSGVHSSTIFLVAGLASVTKLVLAFRFVLLTALDKEGLGSGQLDGNTALKVHFTLMIYMVLEFNTRTVMSYRHSRALNLSFVAANAAPAALVSVVLFVWAHAAITSLMETLAAKKDEQKGSLFGRTRGLLWLAAPLAAAAAALQVLDPTAQEDASMWKYHSLVTDGSTQLLFALVLCAAMMVWLPSEGVQGYEYSAQSQDGAVIGAPSGVIWDDDALDEEAKGGGAASAEEKPVE